MLAGTCTQRERLRDAATRTSECKRDAAQQLGGRKSLQNQPRGPLVCSLFLCCLTVQAQHRKPCLNSLTTSPLSPRPPKELLPHFQGALVPPMYLAPFNTLSMNSRSCEGPPSSCTLQDRLPSLLGSTPKEVVRKKTDYKAPPVPIKKDNEDNVHFAYNVDKNDLLHASHPHPAVSTVLVAGPSGTRLVWSRWVRRPLLRGPDCRPRPSTTSVVGLSGGLASSVARWAQCSTGIDPRSLPLAVGGSTALWRWSLARGGQRVGEFTITLRMRRARS